MSSFPLLVDASPSAPLVRLTRVLHDSRSPQANGDTGQYWDPMGVGARDGCNEQRYGNARGDQADKSSKRRSSV